MVINLMQDGNLHCHVKNITRRGKDGRLRSVVAKAAYNSGEALPIEREDRTTTLPTRHDVVYTAVITPKGAPAWARERAQLWNAVEANVKRKDGRLAKEVVVAITRGIPPEQWPELAADYVQPWLDEGQIADVAIHEDGSLHNPHLHVLLTVHALQPNGFGRKLPTVNQKAFVKTARTHWADLTNAYLKANGLSVRVDARSYKARGIAAQPTQHRGPNPAERRARRARLQNQSQPTQGATTMARKSPDPTVTTDRRWFEQAVDGLAAADERQPAKPDQQVEQSGPAAELQALTADAPDAVREALAAEIAYQQQLAAVADERTQRLDLLHERLEPDQRAALERYLGEQRQNYQDYPQPEPGPDGEPMLPSSLDRARRRMTDDYEREEPER
ncbi:MAG: MobA/MobL family protein [Rhizobiales bacterium]|nr:MobA/MobL family protein [Hyphomicrobiales bacterium]MBO6697858.1 MobA/MobL family protein [Hyphomicrobiales bacterium]MBO6735888.1 MobA/MobL family protein [Hyphomicrobiales bacterium]MBO6913899.1 MobA/MobL family protein [Hyphomicrobiales bacterium]MBO6955602.1 MobA/MobL family protein [Hyphomicrobiales bacterium]